MTSRQTILIAASPEEAVDLSQDYSRRLEWDPFLKSAELMNGATQAGVGVRAWCVARNGYGMETEYVSFNRPRTIAVKMTRGPKLLHSFAGSWHFEPIGQGQTQVSFTYHLRARPTWLSWLLTPLLTRIFAHDTKKRLVALKLALEKHQPIQT